MWGLWGLRQPLLAPVPIPHSPYIPTLLLRLCLENGMARAKGGTDREPSEVNRHDRWRLSLLREARLGGYGGMIHKKC